MSSNHTEIGFLTSLISGGIAGTSVDVALFPLDTIKTRLQSSQGFLKAGGFRGIYKGLSAAAAGSAPGAALFFSTYETTKAALIKNNKSHTLAEPVVHMIAACCGEVMACLVRVPTEVIKQRMQTGMHGTLSQTISATLGTQGISSLYRGFGITVMREIPFALIQFPLYEAMKKSIAQLRAGSSVDTSSLDQTTLVKSYEGAVCGSLAGGIAAALTTPLDVVKTRLMLGSDVKGVPYKGIIDTVGRLYSEGRDPLLSSRGGVGIFFSGVGPRVMWISIGGFVFFGAYEQSIRLLKHVL